MSKHTYFTGQPVLAQVINLIPHSLVRHLAKEYKSDYYCKRFFSWDHLISMLFATLSGCQSLREVTTGMLAAEGKLTHLGLKHTPRRSTLSDANTRRSEVFFGAVFTELVAHFYPDSRMEKGPKTEEIKIVDSTTISLFSDVLANAGRPDKQGRRKGGVKAHTVISSSHNTPEFVVLTPASAHDTPFLTKLTYPPGSILCFDKGYMNYRLFKQWSEPDRQIRFVSRLRSNASVEVLQECSIPQEERDQGVLSDQIVILGHTSHKQVTRFRARLIRFCAPDSNKQFCFYTNLFTLSALQIAQIYRKRWQIELIFKRIKGAWPLRYFLGDSPNAIKIQIWCALIADLLLEVLRKRCARHWSYANLKAMIRLHSFSYVDLTAFLKDPMRALLQAKPRPPTWDLFSKGGLQTG